MRLLKAILFLPLIICILTKPSSGHHTTKHELGSGPSRLDIFAAFVQSCEQNCLKLIKAEKDDEAAAKLKDCVYTCLTEHEDELAEAEEINRVKRQSL